MKMHLEAGMTSTIIKDYFYQKKNDGISNQYLISSIILLKLNPLLEHLSNCISIEDTE